MTQCHCPAFAFLRSILCQRSKRGREPLFDFGLAERPAIAVVAFEHSEAKIESNSFSSCRLNSMEFEWIGWLRCEPWWDQGGLPPFGQGPAGEDSGWFVVWTWRSCTLFNVSSASSAGEFAQISIIFSNFEVRETTSHQLARESGWLKQERIGKSSHLALFQEARRVRCQ